MNNGGWAAFCAVVAVTSAGTYLVNQYYKVPGDLLVFWMRVGILAALAPFAFFVPWPSDPLFYAVVAVTAVCGVYADVRMMNVAAQYGGGIVARVQPFVVPGAFLLWLLFDPVLARGYMEDWTHTLMIVATLGLCVFFAMQQNRCPLNRAALVAMAPALLGYTLTVVLNKFAMGLGVLTGAVYGYMFVQSALALPLVGALMLKRKRKARAPVNRKKLLTATALMVFFWVTGMTFKNYAFGFVPNPAYQVAIKLTAPVFIAAFYFLTKHKEEGDVKYGLGVVFCAIVLTLLTA